MCPQCPGMSVSDSSWPNAVLLPVALAAAACLVALWLWRSWASSSEDVPAAHSERKALRQLTRGEVAEHAAPGDCWIVVKGRVYDVTSYVEEHPGGRAILRNAGGDATAGFHGPQHPPRVFDMIDDFLIGDVIT